MQDLPTSSSLVVSHEGHKHNITQLAGPKWKLHGGLLNQKKYKQLETARLRETLQQGKIQRQLISSSNITGTHLLILAESADPGRRAQSSSSYVESKICHKIQNPKSPRSKIQNPQNPKSSAKIQNLGRWGPHIKICYITIQNLQNPKFGDFGFWILDSGDFGFWIWGILDFGFGGFGILDLGDFGFWILGILDFGFWGFWILDFADFGALGRSRGCTTRQFGDGAWRSEARIPPGPPFRDSAKPTLSDIVGARKQIELQKPGAQEVKTIFYTFLHDF